MAFWKSFYHLDFRKKPWSRGFPGENRRGVFCKTHLLSEEGGGGARKEISPKNIKIKIPKDFFLTKLPLKGIKLNIFYKIIPLVNFMSSFTNFLIILPGFSKMLAFGAQILSPRGAAWSW